MASRLPGEITALLKMWGEGDETALENLTPLVYRELHRLARRYMSRERPGHTLQTTALINELYLRLVDWKSVEWQNRAHFFGVSSTLMRHILVRFARSRKYSKRGSGLLRVSLSQVDSTPRRCDLDVVALDDALNSLAALDSRQARVVELRFFGGLNVKESAEVLGVSAATVQRDWRIARAWLYRELSRSERNES
jgi:RNA polymerase sigma factor (TIGR02999 family)